MEPAPTLFCFDYLDPLSWLVQRELDALAEEDGAPPLRRLPLELRPPPLPLLDPDGPPWTELWARACELAVASGTPLEAPSFLPWTRKAHELLCHARAKGVEEAVHRALFHAVFQEGRDVGRVDVLVELARGVGLDPMETKATLDVDRWSDEVEAFRREAEAAGAQTPPTLVRGDLSLQGFHNRDALRTFLLR